MTHSQGTFQGANGTELFYQVWHPADQARAIIIGLHGHGDHSCGLRSMVDHLAPLNFCWYGFDLRGHGRSPGIRGHIDEWADIQGDLKSFLHFVKGREPNSPVFLIGHSLGGLICLDYVIHNPEYLKGIIAISPLLGYSGLSYVMKLFLGGMSHVKPDFIFKGQAQNEKLTRDPEVLKSLAVDPLRHNRISAGCWCEIDSRRKWVCAHATDLHLPLLMLYGLTDRITPARPIRTFFHSVSLVEKELHEYEEARHRPFDDLNQTEVLDHISSWLNARLDASKYSSQEKHTNRTNQQGQDILGRMMISTM